MNRKSGSQRPLLEPVKPYTRLAPVYDAVMDHVDYDGWVAYILDLLARHEARVRSILELGCGTGSFAQRIVRRLDVAYRATDGSEDMIEVARKKLDGSAVELQILDFTEFSIDKCVDLILLLYDGINYLVDERDVEAFLSASYAALRDGAWLVFDQSTPSNSLNNEGAFDYSGSAAGSGYLRKSNFDPVGRIHQTDFEIMDGHRRYLERHVQKAYLPVEMQELIRRTPFDVVARYDGFTFRAGNDCSERLHWVLRKGQSDD